MSTHDIPTKTAALPPGLGAAIGRRAGIGAAGGALAGAAGGALNAGEGNRMQGALQGGLAGGAAGGALGAASSAMRNAPQLVEGMVPSVKGLRGLERAEAVTQGLNMRSGAEGLKNLEGVLTSTPGLVAGGVGTLGLGAMAAPGTAKQAAIKTAGAAQSEYAGLRSALEAGLGPKEELSTLLKAYGINTGLGAAAGTGAGAMAAGPDHRGEGALRGGIGGAIGGGLHTPLMAHLAGSEHNLHPFLAPVMGSFLGHGWGETARPKQAAVNPVALAAIPVGAVAGGLGGAAAGALGGALGADEGHRWEGAGRGALRGGALGAVLGGGSGALGIAGGNASEAAVLELLGKGVAPPKTKLQQLLSTGSQILGNPLSTYGGGAAAGYLGAGGESKTASAAYYAGSRHASAKLGIA